MTEADRIKTAKEKGERLVAWFKDKPRPASPFKLDVCTTVNDADKALDILFERVLHAPPMRAVFISSYNHLLTFKKYFENEYAGKHSNK